NIERLEINNCNLNRNGRNPIYTPGLFTSSADDDGIGIGQSQGCFAKNIIITNCRIYDSGEVEGSTDTGGAGIYLGTSVDSDVQNIEITYCTIENSHGWGIHIDPDDCSEGTISDNTLRYNVNAHKNSYQYASRWFENNYSQFAGINITHAATVTGNTIKNNRKFYANTGFDWWGEVVLENWSGTGFNGNTLGSSTGDFLMKHIGIGQYYANGKTAYAEASGNSTNDIWQ
ncbi:MAG: hypothetical protein ACYC4Q_05590, partial [Victivallaceae bacterium]